MTLAEIAADALDAIAAALPDVRQTVEFRISRKEGGSARVASFPVVADVREGDEGLELDGDTPAPKDGSTFTLRVKDCDWPERTDPCHNDEVRLSPRGRGVAVFKVSEVEHLMGGYFRIVAKIRRGAAW